LALSRPASYFFSNFLPQSEFFFPSFCLVLTRYPFFKRILFPLAQRPPAPNSTNCILPPSYLGPGTYPRVPNSLFSCRSGYHPPHLCRKCPFACLLVTPFFAVLGLPKLKSLLAAFYVPGRELLFFLSMGFFETFF